MPRVLAPPLKVWTCDKCGLEERHATTGADQRWHRCKAVGIDMPLLERNADARVVLREREDYIGAEHGLTFVDDRPVMAVVTERGDGSNDVTVLPGVARVQLG